MIESVKNNIIKETTRILKNKSDEFFAVEGYTMLEEALKSDYIPEYILVDSFSNEINGFIDTKIYEVKSDILKKLSNTNSGKNIISVFKKKVQNKSQIVNGNYVLCDRVSDPGNLGTILRIIDAFDIKGCILMEGSCDIYNDKVIRSSMGAIFRVPCFKFNNSDLDILVENNFNILSSVVSGGKDISNVLKNNNILVLGNESHGVSDEIKKISNHLVSIKMPGRAESLNVAIAAGILIYQML